MRILILEDDVLTALDIKGLVEGALDAEIVMCASVRSAKANLGQRFDFAFLDIDVMDGKSFDVARSLLADGTPFVFVSGAARDTIPSEFASVRFVPKPFSGRELIGALAARCARTIPNLNAHAS